MDLLSVVIPTYNKALLLERTLQALQRQRMPHPFEVVVVDDASSDGTPRLLRTWERRLPLRALRQPHNQGRARARNRGWREARGTTVLFLDDDILLEPDALAAHRAAQLRQRGAWLGEVRTAPEIVDSPLFEYLDSRGIAKHGPGDRVPARYFLTQNVSLPRGALERVEGFDESFSAYGFEDMELAFRLEDEAGLPFYFLDGGRGWHLHHHEEREYFAKKRECGRHTLPRLARLHPARLPEMQLDLVVTPLQELPPHRRRLARLLRQSFRWGGPRLAAALQAALARCPVRPGMSHLYDYRVLAAYHQGLQQGPAERSDHGNGDSRPPG